MSRHQDPDNAEHHTLARMWATNPRGVLRGVGAALLALYILERAGVIQALGEWMTRLP